MTEKEIKNTAEKLKVIQAVITEIANAKNTLATGKTMVAEIMPEIIGGLLSKDFEKVATMLFQKVGKISFYQAYLRAFFEYNHVLLKYDVNRKTFVWYGDFANLKKLSYADFLEKEKAEREKAKAEMSTAEKLDRRFSSLEKLDKESLNYLADKIRKLLKAKI